MLCYSTVNQAGRLDDVGNSSLLDGKRHKNYEIDCRNMAQTKAEGTAAYISMYLYPSFKGLKVGLADADMEVGGPLQDV